MPDDPCYLSAMTGLAAIREKAAQIREIAATHGARNVRVVGSVARGTDRPDSDLDLLVTSTEGSASSSMPSWCSTLNGFCNGE